MQKHNANDLLTLTLKVSIDMAWAYDLCPWLAFPCLPGALTTHTRSIRGSPRHQGNQLRPPEKFNCFKTHKGWLVYYCLSKENIVVSIFKKFYGYY